MGQFIGYIGTYTKGDSEGIYSFTLDTEKSEITNIKAVAKLDNPTYVTISDDNRNLYAVAKEGELGGVAAFSINGQTGNLEPLNKQLSAGPSPCHVSTDRSLNYVFSANYHRGTVDSYLINPANGSLDSTISTIQHTGSGPDERQEKPHTHYISPTPDEKYVVAVDLGIDKVITYELHDGALQEVSSVSVKPGSGPRHLTFHPNGQIAYLMTEFSSEVIVFTYQSEDGSLTELQTISTIPADFTENNQGSAIHISSDGKFVYAGNRGHNSIAIFSVNQGSGELSLVEISSSEGDWPRDFMLDPTEKFIIGSNQESNNLVLYSRDEESGKLEVIKSDIPVPAPVCIKFLR
ncbi:lactonase family protein [Fredinandcohnia quinoae]|uniref:Lactonase family protein n=1 Tax=Fredinandcohnia quinoae TaxID=2918902 RepID=A0AAW5DYT7_9BACI|nr:lactonase family protein [Fredinandcohnia sp. SECRCQ15]MCH1625243.1 lactonase family protein [Fredinandcohnia sp. SECRCQ15]